MRALLLRFARSRSGATALEYGLIIALVSIVIIVTAAGIGVALKLRWDTVAERTAI